MRGHASRLTRYALAPTLVGALVGGGLLGAGPAQAQEIRPDFWGIHTTDWVTEAPDADIEFGSANFTTSGTYWTNIEQAPGDYDFDRLEAQVAAAAARGAQPMMVLGYTPNHHTDEDGGDYGYHTTMPDLDAWRTYVAAVVERFGTRLDYQVWPEPNIIENWTGTPDQMAQLTIEAAKVIHEVEPTATVVSPAVTLRLEGQRQWMDDFFGARVGGERVRDHVDAIAIDSFPEKRGTPEDSYDLVREAKRILARHDVGQPVWNNEINYGVEGGGRATPVTYSERVQRSYLIRTYVLSAANRLARTYWLAWFFPYTEAGEPTMAVQLTDQTGDRTSVADSYAVVHRWLDGTDFRGCRETRRGKKKGLWTCTAKAGRRDVHRIYWKPQGRKVKVRTHRTTRAYETQEGRVRRERGRTNLKIGKYPVMVESKR